MDIGRRSIASLLPSSQPELVKGKNRRKEGNTIYFDWAKGGGEKIKKANGPPRSRRGREELSPFYEGKLKYYFLLLSLIGEKGGESLLFLLVSKGKGGEKGGTGSFLYRGGRD